MRERERGEKAGIERDFFNKKYLTEKQIKSVSLSAKGLFNLKSQGFAPNLFWSYIS